MKLPLLICVALSAASITPTWAGPGFPRGWAGGSTRMQDYDYGTAPIAGATGKQAAYIKAKPGADHSAFFSMTQCVDAANYLGARMRVSARLKSVGAGAEQLWMRVDGKAQGANKSLGFYNMDDRPIKGTTDWKQYDVVLDVPTDSTGICYGFFLAGGLGEAWADNFAFEKVSKTVPVSVMPGLKKAPVNLNFDP